MNIVFNSALLHIYILTILVICLLIAFNCQLSGRRSLEEELQRQSEFLADIAHRLKTPLTFIFLNIDLAKKFFREKDFSLAEKSLFSAKQATASLSQITSNLITLGKINYGLVKIKKSDFNLSKMIKDTAADFQVLLGERQLKTKIRPGVSFYGDQAKLQEMILNLLDNALKFTHPRTGRIIVKLEQNERLIRLTVQDNGKGIKASDLAHLFKRYYQSESQKMSSGIGLAVVKWIVEGHGGKIEVESKE